jgi:acetoin:2,6-dichlorophenolindophenol oxidoreductase subunit beta
MATYVKWTSYALPTAEEQLGRLRSMLLLRRFEAALLRQPKPGFQLLSCGEEAVAVGVSAALETSDALLCSGRSIAIALARGVPAGGMLAELVGKDGGPNRGRAGRAHVSMPSIGFFGAHGVVGGNISIAAGVALAQQQTGTGAIACCLFGDGACGAGILYETLNVSALWRLPLLFACSNNGYAVSTPVRSALAPARLTDIAMPFGIPAASVDGTDVDAVTSPHMRGRAMVLFFLSCAPFDWGRTRRAPGSTGQPPRWRNCAAGIPWLCTNSGCALRPFSMMRCGHTCRPTWIATLPGRKPSWQQPHGPMRRRRSAMSRLFFREAIARAIAEEMEANPQLILLGQDIGAHGGSYAETRGLFERFGAARVRDTPVAEAVTVGLAAGAAAAGLRPLAFITYLDFLTLGLDALVNYAAKLRFKSAGQLTAPLVIKATAGAKGQGPTHAQSLEPWLMNVPGLTVLAPSTAGDAYGLLKTALRATGPVVFIDHKRLFPRGGEVPDRPELIPAGSAALRRAGRHLTLIAHSYMSVLTLEAAVVLAAEGIEAEVIDLRSLWPIDWDTLAQSARRTGHVLTVEEGQVVCGIGAELAFGLRERVDDLRIQRLGAHRAPVAASPVLEAYIVPAVEDITAAARRLLDSSTLGHSLAHR